MLGAFTVRANNYFAPRRPAAERAATSSTCAGCSKTAPTARRGLQHQQRDPRRADLGERLGSHDQRHLHQRAQRPRVERDPRRPHRRGAGHRRADVLRRRRRTSSASPAAIRSRSGSRTTTRATSPARAVRWCDTRHPHLRLRRGVQLLRAAACGAASTPSRPAAASASTRCRRGRRSTRAPSSSAATRPTTRPTRRPTRSSSTSPSGRRGRRRLRRRSRRTGATTSSSRTSGGVSNNLTLNLGRALRQPATDAEPATTTSRRAPASRGTSRGNGTHRRARRRRQVLRLRAGGARPDAAAEQRA